MPYPAMVANTRALRLLGPILVLLATGSLSAAQPTPAPPRPRIVGLSHVGLWVRDFARSREFYKGYLGFDEPYSLTNKDGSINITWIKINDRQTVELFPMTDATPAAGDSLYHVALETEDAQAMLDYLASRGVRGPGGKPLPGTVKKGRIGNLNFFTEDPDKHIVEFVQYEADGWTRGNVGKAMPTTRIAARISHAGVCVGNLERSLGFYRDILGMREFWRGSGDGVTLSWVNERLPEGDDYIELMLYRTRPSVETLHVLNHVCLEVPDVGAAEATLRGRALPAGCKATTPSKTGVNRKRQINCFDPDGTRVEIMESHTVDGMPATSSPAPAPQADAQG